jgi:hypothetical protein
MGRIASAIAVFNRFTLADGEVAESRDSRKERLEFGKK